MFLGSASCLPAGRVRLNAAMRISRGARRERNQRRSASIIRGAAVARVYSTRGCDRSGFGGSCAPVRSQRGDGATRPRGDGAVPNHAVRHRQRRGCHDRRRALGRCYRALPCGSGTERRPATLAHARGRDRHRQARNAAPPRCADSLTVANVAAASQLRLDAATLETFLDGLGSCPSRAQEAPHLELAVADRDDVLRAVDDAAGGDAMTRAPHILGVYQRPRRGCRELRCVSILASAFPRNPEPESATRSSWGGTTCHP
jgi:hypothetical protein